MVGVVVLVGPSAKKIRLSLLRFGVSPDVQVMGNRLSHQYVPSVASMLSGVSGTVAAAGGGRHVDRARVAIVKVGPLLLLLAWHLQRDDRSRHTFLRAEEKWSRQMQQYLRQRSRR